MSGFWNADSDRDWDSYIHRHDEPRTMRKESRVMSSGNCVMCGAKRSPIWHWLSAAHAECCDACFSRKADTRTRPSAA